jgi:hypothetical protein
MPIPQFHRTPKTRRRRTHRAASVQENFDVQNTEVDIDEGASSADELIDAEDCALLQPEDRENSPPSSEEVPALLSSWPPHRSK